LVVRSQTPAPPVQQNVKFSPSHVAAHFPASQKVFVGDDPHESPPPLHTTLASAPLRTEPWSQLDSPVHLTIDVPSERAEMGSLLQTSRATHPISQNWVVSHVTPCVQDPLPTSPPAPQRTEQLLALQVTGSFVQLLRPVHAITHAPASQLTPVVHESEPAHSTLQARPLQETG
jgi:hypothetical protein